MTAPRTEAGRALLAALREGDEGEYGKDHPWPSQMEGMNLDSILDIEAEAEQTAISELKAGFYNVHDWGHAHFGTAEPTRLLRALLLDPLPALPVPMDEKDEARFNRESAAHSKRHLEADDAARAYLNSLALPSATVERTDD